MPIANFHLPMGCERTPPSCAVEEPRAFCGKDITGLFPYKSRSPSHLFRFFTNRNRKDADAPRSAPAAEATFGKAPVSTEGNGDAQRWKAKVASQPQGAG